MWCLAADTHLKLMDSAVCGAWFLTGGVFECDFAHRQYVAVLSMLYKGSNRLCISHPQHATSLLKIAHRGSTAGKCMYPACFDISSCSAASSVQCEQSQWEVVWCGCIRVEQGCCAGPHRVIQRTPLLVEYKAPCIQRQKFERNCICQN